MSKETQNLNTIKSNYAEKIAQELWNKIVNESLFSYQKTDICDYLLYLFDKHGGNFLHYKSNAENETLLKISTSKIKASRKNIFVKFMNEKDRQKIFKDFLLSLSPKNEQSIVKDGKNGNLEFLIENNVLRDILEEKLKKWTQNTFTYSLNKEKLEISCESFVTMVKKEVEKAEKLDEYELIVKDLEKRHTISSVKQLAKKGAKFIKDFAPLIAQIL